MKSRGPAPDETNHDFHVFVLLRISFVQFPRGAVSILIMTVCTSFLARGGKSVIRSHTD